MGKLKKQTYTKKQKFINDVYESINRRILYSPEGICHVEFTNIFLNICIAQICGKCVPCRIGLPQIATIIYKILKGEISSLEIIDDIKDIAKVILETADCVIGVESAKMILNGINNFKDEYVYHIKNKCCKANDEMSIPCISNCPANVDVPGYISLILENRFDDAVWLIRKDNPFPSSCSYVCDEPCSRKCRRILLDESINIRGLKRVAVENAGKNLKKPWISKPTNKKIAIIGGGASGLTCAYYLQQMGHSCTIFEKNRELGGMLRYGIPAYRLPRYLLENDINFILSLGIKVNKNIKIKEEELKEIKRKFDALYIAVGAHKSKKLNIPNANAKNVFNAVEFLYKFGGEEKDYPDLTGKVVCVIGGGNVAIDCARTSIRCNAKRVYIIYPKRQKDMTASKEEVSEAIKEGVVLKELMLIKSISVNKDKTVAFITTQKQIVGNVDNGDVKINKKNSRDVNIKCDLVIVAIGQAIDSQDFKKTGIGVKKGMIKTDEFQSINSDNNIFAGGDCVSGPKNVINAIAAGKVAAGNIDYFLGYNHKIRMDIKLPEFKARNIKYMARIDTKNREIEKRKKDFKLVELPMSKNEAKQESSRCLRCDIFGCSNFRKGRNKEW